MSAIDQVYQGRILEFAGDIPRLGRLENPDASAKVTSRACGSTITVDIKLGNGMITDYAHEVDACALGSASASIVARLVVGRPAEELRALRQRMEAMLKRNGIPPDGYWSDLEVLEPGRAFANRHQSILLPFNAIVRALDRVEAGRS